MAAAWRERERQAAADAEAGVDADGTGSNGSPSGPSAPDDWAAAPQDAAGRSGEEPVDPHPSGPSEPPEPPAAAAEPGRATRSALRAFALLPLLVLAVVAAQVLGVAGWRGGTAFVPTALGALALGTGLLLTRGQHLRVAYVAGGLVMALVGSAWCVSTAPMSHGRLEQVIDRIPTGVLQRVRTSRSGHGWCRPEPSDCPTVVVTYAVPTLQPAAALRNAVSALQNGGLIPKDAGRVAFTRSIRLASAGQDMSIDNQRYTSVVRATASASGGTTVTVTITSRRGIREKPLSPVRAR